MDAAAASKEISDEADGESTFSLAGWEDGSDSAATGGSVAVERRGEMVGETAVFSDDEEVSTVELQATSTLNAMPLTIKVNKKDGIKERL